MIGLLRKDYYGSQQLWKQYIGLTLFISLFGFIMKSNSYPMMMGMIMSINMVLNLLTLDEKGGWAYLLAAPVSRRMMIKEKYIFNMLLEGILLAGCSVISLLITVVHRLDLGEFLVYLISAFAYFFLVTAIAFPINIKVGVEIGRFISTGVFLLPAIVLLVVAMAMKNNGMSTEVDTAFVGMISAVALLITFVMWVASYFISVNIFLKKEIQ